MIFLDGKLKAPLARISTNVKGPKVGQYTVMCSEFEMLAVKCIRDVKKDDTDSVIVIDEIGKMENFSQKFVKLVREVFDKSDKDLVATIPVKYDNLNIVKEIVNRDDVEIVEVTKYNRDDLKQILLEKLRK